MRTSFRSFTAAVAVSTVCLFSAHASDAPTSAEVRTALGSLEKWLQSGPNSQGWQTYLNLPGLQSELNKTENPDPAVIAGVLKQLNSGVPGLELEPFTKLADALGQWSEDLAIAKAADLSEAALASEANFRPITEADVARDKQSLQAAVTKLDRYLAAGGANGDGWKTFLHWKDLENQLQAKTPDFEILKAVQQQFTADQEGLELPIFAAVGAALGRYRTDVEAQQGDLKAQFVAQLKALAEELKQYSQSQTDENSSAVGARLGWLINLRQAPALVRAIRGQYSHPNLHVQMSERLVAAGIEQPVDETAPVYDNILGTSISGTGHTVAHVVANLVPSENGATIETQLVGKTYTKTIGVNGPASIYTNGATDISGRKQIVIDANGVASLPATATAATHTQITGVGARSGMVQRIASSKVYESKSEAEAIGSQHAADRVRNRLESQTLAQLAKAQDSYLSKFRNPLVRRGEFPALLQFSSTDDWLRIRALQANQNQLGAPHAPPTERVPSDLAVQVHESLANNLAAALLGGLTLKEEELQAKVIEWRGSLPDQLKSEEDRDPWSITFAKSRPVTVKFSDAGIQITVRGQRYTSGERAFRAMNVTADYKLESNAEGLKLVRQGDLQIFPPGFAAGQRLSTQQVTLKTLLQRKFGKLFEPEIKSQGLVLPGRWEQAGRLDLKQMQSQGGWLLLAWLESGQPAKPVDKVAAQQN